MLIEGMAESLLMPVFAARMFPERHIPEHQDRTKWKRFKSATLIAIDGVDFEPYVRLLLTSYQEDKDSESIRIADKVVVVTDRDPNVPGDRNVSLQGVGDNLGVVHGQDFAIYYNNVSFEHALYSEANTPILRAAFLDLRPASQKRWKTEVTDVSADKRADGFWDLFDGKRNPLRKGDYAQTLALMLAPRRENYVPKAFVDDHPGDADGASVAYKASIAAFKIPKYIEEAIKDIVEGDG